ncbi:hypothetical protein PVAP13_8NG149101 [Panicum virgatum]|uniref:Uncharacterized protein n=1 Tax=Panicum virgatum TaxID=38727 RepID=A0A8T0P9D1_PANVG|nr:hypothetical protein PVAP13_8NG149101 [Panicum virgatum]
MFVLVAGDGVYLCEGNHISSDDAGGAGALSSLQRVTVDGHGPPGPVASKGD